MKNFFIFLVFAFWSSMSQACPNCAGSTVAETEDYTFLILGGFIVLTYIPFYLLFKRAYKSQAVILKPKDTQS